MLRLVVASPWSHPIAHLPFQAEKSNFKDAPEFSVPAFLLGCVRSASPDETIVDRLEE
jgi:hypothetical protein